jgi:hypothetical protein
VTKAVAGEVEELLDGSSGKILRSKKRQRLGKAGVTDVKQPVRLLEFAGPTHVAHGMKTNSFDRLRDSYLTKLPEYAAIRR